MLLVYTILAMAGLWFGVHWAFVAVMHANAVRKRGALSTYWLVMLAPLAITGLVLDAAFNLTFGTVMYREPPPLKWAAVRILGRSFSLPLPELLFTSRCQRHIEGTGSRQRIAAFWQRQLNQFDPGHV